MLFKLKLNLEFDGALIFREFLPETDSDALSFDLHNEYRVKIYLSNRDEQTNHVGDLPPDVSKHQTLRCRGLTVEVDVLNADRDVLSALDANQPTEQTEEFGKEIFCLVKDVNNRLVDYFRNIAKQFWIEPIAADPRNWQNFLDARGTVWLDSSGKWRRFLVARENVIHIEARFFTGGLDRITWRDIVAFMEDGAQATMTDVLISNSLKHLDENNGRLAVVESVIALEIAINRLLPRVIVRLPGAPQIEQSQLSRLIEKAGLRIVTKVGLTLIQTLAGLDLQDIETVSESLNTRNEIVHGGRRSLQVSLARNYVFAIRRVIATFEKWLQESSEETLPKEQP